MEWSWSLPAHTNLTMGGFTVSFYDVLMGSTIFWMYWSPRFPSDFCSAGTHCGNNNSHFLPLLASQATFDISFDGFHLSLPAMYCPWPILTPSLLLSLCLSIVMMAFYSFCFLPLYCMPLKKNLPKPRTFFCLKHWIKLEHPGLFPALKQIFKTASLFSSAKSPPLSDFQVSSASTSSCFSSYDQIFGIAQGQ